MSKPSKYSQATKEQRSLMDKEYEQNRKKGAKEFVSSVTGQKLAITENQKNWKKGEFQLNRQLEENQKRGKFNKDYLIVDDVNSTVHKVSKDHKVQRSIPAVTGKNKGEHVPESAKSWVGKNPGKTFNDYIDHLDKTNQKITPSGEFEINGKRRDPSAPKSKSEKLKYALYKSGAQKLAQTVIANKPELFNLPGASTVFNDWDVRKQRYEKYGDGMLTLKDSKTGQGIGTAIHGTNTTKRLEALSNPDAAQRKLSASCINLPNGDIIDLRTGMKVGAKVQMMPEDSTKVISDPNLPTVKPIGSITKIQQPINSTVAESTGFNNYIPKFEKGTQSIKFNNNMKNKSKKYSGGTGEVKLTPEDRLAAMGKKRAKPMHSAYKDASTIKKGIGNTLSAASPRRHNIYKGTQGNPYDKYEGPNYSEAERNIRNSAVAKGGTLKVVDDAVAKLGNASALNSNTGDIAKAKTFKNGGTVGLVAKSYEDDPNFVGPKNPMKKKDTSLDGIDTSSTGINMSTANKATEKSIVTKAQSEIAGKQLARGGNAKIAKYQEMLNKKYNAGLKVDGAWGEKTKSAYEKYDSPGVKKNNEKVTAKEIGAVETKAPSSTKVTAKNATPNPGEGYERGKVAGSRPKDNNLGDAYTRSKRTPGKRSNVDVLDRLDNAIEEGKSDSMKQVRSGRRYGDGGEQAAAMGEAMLRNKLKADEEGKSWGAKEALTGAAIGLASYGIYKGAKGAKNRRNASKWRFPEQSEAPTNIKGQLGSGSQKAIGSSNTSSLTSSNQKQIGQGQKTLPQSTTKPKVRGKVGTPPAEVAKTPVKKTTKEVMTEMGDRMKKAGPAPRKQLNKEGTSLTTRQAEWAVNSKPKSTPNKVNVSSADKEARRKQAKINQETAKTPMTKKQAKRTGAKKDKSKSNKAFKQQLGMFTEGWQ